MFSCPFSSTPNQSADCVEQRCGVWDKERKVCGIIRIHEDLEEVWRALDNLARELNQAVLRR